MPNTGTPTSLIPHPPKSAHCSMLRRSPRLNPHLSRSTMLPPRKRHAPTPPRKRRRTNPTNVTTILHLPDEVIVRIVSYLTSSNLRTRSLATTVSAVALAHTCTRLHALVRLALQDGTHTVDAVFPGRADGPKVHLPLGRTAHLSLISGMLCNSLREIRLPVLGNVEMVLEAVANCTALEKLAFVDGETVGSQLAKKLLTGKPRLDVVEVTQPGMNVLTALKEGCEATDISLLGIRARWFGRLKAFLRASGKRLKRFGIGFNGEEVRIRNIEAITTAKSLLNYFVNYAKRDMPNVVYFRLVCNLAGSWFLGYMQRLVGLLCPTTDVEIVVMGMPLVFPTMRDGLSESYHRSISLLMIARLPANIVMHAYSDGIFRPDTVELNGHHEHLLQYLRAREDDVRDSVAAIVRRANPHLRRLQVQFTCVSVQGFRLVVRCLSDILQLAPGITEIEVSREMIVYGGRREDGWRKFLKLCGNIRVIHLNAPEKYVRVTKLPRVGNVRIVRELGVFLDMIGKHCPKLESVYLEDAGHIGGMRDKGRMLKPIREAMRLVDGLEMRLPSCDAGSVRAQLQRWFRECCRG